jgi:hypothetical protein
MIAGCWNPEPCSDEVTAEYVVPGEYFDAGRPVPVFGQGNAIALFALTQIWELDAVSWSAGLVAASLHAELVAVSLGDAGLVVVFLAVMVA